MNRTLRILSGAAAVSTGILAVWIILDLTDRTPHDLRRFDGRDVGRLETDMWRSYYGHQRLRLFNELTCLLEKQYHLPFWRATVGAYHAAKAAVVFQRGHGRADYEKALPDLAKFYELIRGNSATPFDVGKVSRLEMEWWIVHRERSRHPASDLESALADLQAAIYQEPASKFADHARARAEAMLIRDTRAETGPVTEADWDQIGALLERSWVSLEAAVTTPSGPRNGSIRASQALLY